MNPETSGNNNRAASRRTIDIIIRVTALALLLYWSFKILEPFIGIFIWSVILSVSEYPLFTSIAKRLKGKKVWAATLLSLMFLLVLIGPAVWLALSTADDIIALKNDVNQNGVAISPPPPGVKEIPVIGRKLDQLWTEASVNFEQFAQKNSEKMKEISLRILGIITSVGKGLLLLAAAIIVSAVLMVYGQPAGKLVRSFFIRLAGDDGEDMARVAEVTIRNVTRGILGVAAIQSLLAGIGMVVGGVPLAGLWTLLWLILAIVQVPPIPIALGVIIYLWSGDTSTIMAVILTIWMLVVGLLDNVLKPIMLGKSAPVPMLVVFLGAIGGFIFTGFTGLFTGAIVLSLAYKLFEKWLHEERASS